jgi:CEP19-like protein
VKDKMTIGFQSNVVKPGDPDYEFDKRQEFNSTKPSEWDDDEDDDDDDDDSSFELSSSISL